MNLIVTGHHLVVTPALRSYVEAKLDRVLRHFDRVIDVNVILSVEKLKQRCEVTVHVRGKDIFVEAEDANLYAAVDLLANKLDRAVSKHKTRTHGYTHVALKHHPTA